MNNKETSKRSHKKLLALISLIAIVALIISAYQFWRYNQQMKKDEIISIAQDYVNVKFSQTMVFDSIEYYSVERIYFVHFHNSEIEDLLFTVFITRAHSASHYSVWKDDYYQMLCKYLLTSSLNPEFEKIWGGKATFWITLTWDLEIEERISPLQEPIDLSNPNVKSFLNNKYELTLALEHWDTVDQKKKMQKKYYRMPCILCSSMKIFPPLICPNKIPSLKHLVFMVLMILKMQTIFCN